MEKQLQFWVHVETLHKFIYFTTNHVSRNSSNNMLTIVDCCVFDNSTLRSVQNVLTEVLPQHDPNAKIVY